MQVTFGYKEIVLKSVGHLKNKIVYFMKIFYQTVIIMHAGRMDLN